MRKVAKSSAKIAHYSPLPNDVRTARLEFIQKEILKNLDSFNEKDRDFVTSICSKSVLSFKQEWWVRYFYGKLVGYL